MTREHALQLFRTRDELSLGELARALKVSERQVRRIIGTLRAQGLTVHERQEGREKRFRLDEADRGAATAVDLTERERLALSVAAQAAETLFAGTPLSGPLAAAAAKVALVGEEPVTYEPEALPGQWGFGTLGHAQVDAGRFQRLVEAVTACETVAIAYTNLQGARSEERKVDPYAVALRGSSWLLVGRDHRHRAVRSFALAAVEEVAGTGAYFERPAGFSPEAYFRDSLSAFTGGAVEEVRLRVAAAAAEAFRRKQYHPTQQSKDAGAGALEVSFEVAGLEEVAAFARSFGPLVEVLAPPALRSRMAEEAAAVCRLYEGG